MRIGGLGELIVNMACPLPPVIGRSASVRLCFRFVLVVRSVSAGEAKLHGRMTIVVGIAGPPRCEFLGASTLLFAWLLMLFAWVRRGFWCILCLLVRFSLLFICF